MSVKFEKLYNHFDDEIVGKFNLKSSRELVDVEILSDTKENLSDSCVYIARASFIKNSMDHLKDISLILIQDDVIDFNNHIDNNLSVIELNSSSDVYEVFNDVKTIFRRDAQYNQFKVQLLELVVTDVGLKEIVEVASQMIGNPLIVIDLSFKVLVSCPIKYITDALWYDNVQKGYCSYEFIGELKKLKSIKESGNTNHPFEVTCPESPTKKVVSRIRVENKVVGNIILLECQRKIDDDDYDYLELISDIISKELKKKHFYKNTRNTLREEIIYDLLENNLDDEKMMQERLEHSHLVFHKYICIYAIDISKYKMKHSIYERFLETQILKFFPHGYLIYYQNHIVIINTKKESRAKTGKLKELVRFLSENNLSMGCSNVFSTIKSCKVFYNQAVLALKIGSIVDQDGFFYQYEDIQPYVFVYRFKDSLLKEDFLNNQLNLINIYDDENQSDLYKTLYAYLKNNHNITKAADEIHVHRNTLRYRLEKITEILGVDIDEDDNSFKLYSAIKMMDFYDKLTSSNSK